MYLARLRLSQSREANTKVGSIQSYQESKQRILDLGELLNGSRLPGEAKTETNWSNLMDRAPLMQLLKWAHNENLTKMAASEKEFASNKDSLRSYAELVSILGKISLAEDMPDATDDDYQAFVRMMVEHSQQVVMAVANDNADMARKAAGQLGQSCQDCHDNFR